MSPEVVVVGSGAGGAVTAALLAEAGMGVRVLEEGPWVEPGTVAALSMAQMRSQYRYMGQGIALGRPPTAYAEGRCVGGSTEVNSGLYHRTPDQVLAEWRTRPGLEDLTPEALEPVFRVIESDLSVGLDPLGLAPAAERLVEGATRLGWAAREVPRWEDHGGAGRRSMLRSYLPRAVAAGAVVQPDTRVRRLVIERGAVTGVEIEGANGRATIAADQVVVCAGAIGTAALLQRSGIGRGVGRLVVHPWAKVVAEFAEVVNRIDTVPSAQVHEFSPDLNLGCGAATPAMLGLALLRTADGPAAVADSYERQAIFYAAVRPHARGRVRAVPGQRDPVVLFQPSPRDMALILSGVRRLALLALAAGASSVVPSARGAAAIRDAADIDEVMASVRPADLDLMSVHLMATVPMGAEPGRSVLDPFGRSHRIRGLAVNDAAMLPGATGVNPQGTIMALATRNVQQWLREG